MSAVNGHASGPAMVMGKKGMRRGFLTGAAALSAAMVAKVAGPAETAHAVDGQPLVVGQENSTGATTTLTNVPAPTGIAAGQFRSVTNNATAAVVGQSSGGGAGVRGQSSGTSASIGVIGVSTAVGVYGETTGTSGPVYGIYGQTTSATTAVIGNAIGSGTGLLGLSGSGNAVYGQSGSSTGVFGFSTSGNGVFGQSAQFVGVLGISSNSRGIYGLTDRGIALYAEATVRTSTPQQPAGFAGYFLGRVFIDGDFTATGTKSAAVKGTSTKGDLVRVYCAEATQAYLEDMGTGTLTGGTAEVELETEFASTIKGDFLVQVTGYGVPNPLLISKKTDKGFTVLEANGGKSSGTFSYRITGLRADIVNDRLPPVELKSKQQGFRLTTAVPDHKPIVVESPKIPELPKLNR